MISKLFLSAILMQICAIMNVMAIDHELSESLKCTRLFSHFEKKFLIPLDTLHSISLKESGRAHSKHKIRLVWPWTVNVEGKGYYFDNKRDAISFVKKQILSGKGSIDIGCMQINLKHHPEAFMSLEQAFDPRKNIEYGASFLRSKYEQLGCWHKAIAHYHSATHELGSKYKQDVIKIAGNMDQYKNSLRKYIRYYSISKSYDYQINDKPSNSSYNRHIAMQQKRQNYITQRPRTARLDAKYKSNIMVNVPYNKHVKSR